MRFVMKAVKVYSNNSVSTVFPDGREAILIGSGIGFGKRPGDEIDTRRIEKHITFRMNFRPNSFNF